MKIKLTEIRNVEPRRAHGNIKELAESIKREGLLQPLVINQNNKLICGRRRFEAVRLLGWDGVEVYQIKTEDDMDKLSKAITENIMRKNLSWAEEVKALAELQQLKEAKYGKAIQGKHISSSYSPSEHDGSIGNIAEETKQSTGKVSQDLQLAKALSEKPELSKCRTKKEALRQIKRERDTERIVREKPILEARGVFKTIVVDPPWQYDTNVIGRTQPEYATMSIEELEKLKLPADTNCHLYLWSTNAFLPKALALGVKWGFEYKTCLTWVKDSIGIGSYFRNSTEHCLFFIKGALPIRARNIPTHFSSKRREHSEKPDKFYKEIVERASFPPYLDIFARQERIGWTIWGHIK